MNFLQISGGTQKGEPYLYPPKDCDICAAIIEIEFIDGKTKQGPWANMCPSCHLTHGVGLGVGKGQMYSCKETNLAGSN